MPIRIAAITICLTLLAAPALLRAQSEQPAQPQRWVPDYRAAATPFDLSGPKAELPATRPSRVPRSPLPPTPPRILAVDLGPKGATTRPAHALADIPPLAASLVPDRPSKPLLPAAPRYSVPVVVEPWLPIPTMVKLRPESPVRPHEPVADPTGNTSLTVLPIWRTTPAAAQRAQIPDPFENIIPLALMAADDDPSVPPLSTPSRVTFPMEKLPAPAPAPAPQPTTRPATQPSK